MDQDVAHTDHAPGCQPFRASILLVPFLVLGGGVILAAIPSLDGTATPWSAATTILAVGLGAAYTAGAVIRTRDRGELGSQVRPGPCTEETPATLGPATGPDEEASPYDGPHSLDPRTVDLGRLVRRTVGRSRSQAQAAGVDLSVVILQDPPILADPGRLTDAITKVLSDAIGQTPGGGHVRVTVAAIDGVAHVQITDPGIGPRTGPGEALATVRRLVEAHAGTLTADSMEERGRTTVNLRLPILPPRRDPGEVG